MKHGRNTSSHLVKAASINWLNMSGDIGKIFLIIIFFLYLYIPETWFEKARTPGMFMSSNYLS